MSKSILIRRKVGPYQTKAGVQVGPFEQLASLRVDAVLALRLSFVVTPDPGKPPRLDGVLLVADLDVPATADPKAPLVIDGLKEPADEQMVKTFLTKAERLLRDFADPTVQTVDIDVTWLTSP